MANNSVGVLRLPHHFVPESVMARAAILVPLTLAVWWWVLKGASLWLLRALAYVPLGLLIAPAGFPPVRVEATTGEWVFNVAVDTNARNLRTGEQQHIESVEFAVSPDNVAFFACGWFSYLALSFSVGPLSKGRAKRIGLGFALQTGVSILCLAAYVYINGYGSIINTTTSRTLSLWLLKYVYHIIYLVVPFAGPFLIALLVHPEWREYCVSSRFSERPPSPTEKPRSKRRK